ncbi:hypothetical protein [Phaeocystidibacter luteus]|uniref:Uncharacterized protein n=1 Tax=Phaeocystidibacter luteus TaxID=911197 RepID=A0A6N6RLX9_9FLAO|nr:hypothetical protein [Phaeocystidibacter luteus]KAB2814579.1 hypothetical protein F8C67_02230 [Phaeocystidibacter luteus]
MNINVKTRYYDSLPTRWPEKMLAFAFEGIRDHWNYQKWKRVIWHENIDFDFHRSSSNYPYKIHHMITDSTFIDLDEPIQFVVHGETDEEFQFMPEIKLVRVQKIILFYESREICILSKDRKTVVLKSSDPNYLEFIQNEGFNTEEQFWNFFGFTWDNRYFHLLHWTGKSY